ncbi:hypothetical protein Leryth_004148 [Lithospermum erythrorhizon]|nr:hypothetical protein Leryth_004148 [Lithospermum erythrorhizon]
MGSDSQLDINQLLACSSDLVELLSDKKDIISLKHHLDQSFVLSSQCHADFQHAKCALQDYQKKIDMCKQKIAEAKYEEATDAELDLLQKELDDELKREGLLRDELRATTNVIDNLESQRVSIEERWLTLKKLEKADKRAEMKLSMYASVTRIIPNLEDKSIISGHIVEKNKKVVEKFEFESSKMTDYNTCNNIWKMIDS